MNNNQALQLGFQHLNNGNLSAASHLFEGVLRQEPQNFAALNGRGFIALQQNRLRQSAADFKQSLAVNPNQPFAHKMLGIVQGAIGEFDASMESFASALAVDGKDPEIYFNRANFRFQVGQMQEALADLDAAIKLRGSYLEARSNRANLLIQLGDFARAEKDLDYLVTQVTNNPNIWVALGLAKHRVGKARESLQCNERALNLVPNHPDALLNSSSAAHDQGEYSAALAWADKAIAATPNRAEAHYARGQALMAISHFDEAIASYSKAIELNPNYAEAWMGRGVTNRILLKFDNALSDYRIAHELSIKKHETLSNIGTLLIDMGRYDESIDAFKQSLTLNPNDDRVMVNLASAYVSSHDVHSALLAYSNALKLNPSNKNAKLRKGYALLSIEKYAEGWELHEERWYKRARPFSEDSLWLGEDGVHDKTILVYAEQGMGDTIQFCRYVKLLENQFARVILLVPESLRRLCLSLSLGVQVFSKLDDCPEYDFQCPIMSLPFAMRSTLKSIPASVPYLFPDTFDAEVWKERLMPTNQLRVGLVWNGGLRKNQPETWRVNQRRNISLHQLERLNISGIQFISLQKGEEAECELERLKKSGWRGPKILDVAETLRDYADTAALVANLDLVISVDTSVAHLAGALGKPVWILNRYDSCWRWLVERTDSPWYPTARIFNQPNPGDWNSVIESVRLALTQILKEFKK